MSPEEEEQSITDTDKKLAMDFYDSIKDVSARLNEIVRSELGTSSADD